ncbi:MAG: hypothetical protein IH991_04435 [Planctomycetes bacterium]|nr:hypothetical protein [Planctomycetota bacterium]
MAYEHCNRRGDVYLLQAGKARTGKPHYYFGRKLIGEPVEEVPAGYEVFESPERGQVYLRKERRACIAPIEREIVAEGIRRASNVDQFIVDVEDDCLVVYLPTRNVNEVNDLVRFLAGPDALQVRRFQEARDRLVRESAHEKAMRFELLDAERRLFHVERWCFRSSHDGWIHLAGPASLPDLVEAYVEHLGEESFFELF